MATRTLKEFASPYLGGPRLTVKIRHRRCWRRLSRQWRDWARHGSGRAGDRPPTGLANSKPPKIASGAQKRKILYEAAGIRQWLHWTGRIARAQRLGRHTQVAAAQLWGYAHGCPWRLMSVGSRGRGQTALSYLVVHGLWHPSPANESSASFRRALVGARCKHRYDLLRFVSRKAWAQRSACEKFSSLSIESDGKRWQASGGQQLGVHLVL